MLHEFLEQPQLRQSLPPCSDERYAGCAVTACAHVVLPIWDVFCPRDDDFGLTVAAMDRWVVSPSAESVSRVAACLQRIGRVRKPDTRGYLSMPLSDWWPPWPQPNIKTRPGEHAGDAIVAAANSLCVIGTDEQWECTWNCLEAAIVAVAYHMGDRLHEDTEEPVMELATAQLRDDMVRRMQAMKGQSTQW